MTTFTVVTRSDVPDDVSVQLLRDVLTRVRALPSVSAVGLTNRLPVRDGGYQGVVTIEGRPDLAGANRPNALYRVVSPEFFQALGMRIVAGRGIDAGDRAPTIAVTVVSESFARAMWPGQSAIGRHVNTGWTGTMVSREVVGVVGETRLTNMTGAVPYAMFVPFEQPPSGSGGAVFAVRGAAAPAVIVPEIRKVVADLDPLVAITGVATMDDVVADALAQPLRLRFFLGVFATLAIVLSAVGVYGTVRYAVVRRRAEFGIHMALGASPARVLGGVVRHALTPVVCGALAGLAGMMLVSRVLRGLLYGVAPSDASSLGAAAGAVLLAATLAAFIPALQASRTNPAESLRAE